MMKIYVVGLGPGNFSQITPAAQEALKAADVVVGYTTYINLIQDLLGDKEVVATGMRSEIERCEQAVELAKQGKQVQWFLVVMREFMEWQPYSMNYWRKKAKLILK